MILENDLDVNQVVAKNATAGNDGKTYVVSFYNLDVIIPLGYKVHSQNGITFRKWANSVLKEYLLKGYVINENRTLITNENYVNLINKVNSIDKRLCHRAGITHENKKDVLATAFSHEELRLHNHIFNLNQPFSVVNGFFMSSRTRVRM